MKNINFTNFIQILFAAVYHGPSFELENISDKSRDESGFYSDKPQASKMSTFSEH